MELTHGWAGGDVVGLNHGGNGGTTVGIEPWRGREKTWG